MVDNNLHLTPPKTLHKKIVQKLIKQKVQIKLLVQFRLIVVPVVGVEPTRPQRTQDFKSCASAISPHRHIKIVKMGERVPFKIL